MCEWGIYQAWIFRFLRQNIQIWGLLNFGLCCTKLGNISESINIQWSSVEYWTSVLVFSFLKICTWFLGDLNHTLYNVWWWNSPTGIKRQNVWKRVWKYSICLILVMFGFFILWAVVDALVKEQILDFACFYGQKTNMANMVKFGYGCINGFIAQKWLISAEGSILKKCRQLLGLNFRIGDWLLWQCWLLVFCWLKVKMWFFGFLDQNVLHAAQQNCIKYQNIYSSNGRRYWW